MDRYLHRGIGIRWGVFITVLIALFDIWQSHNFLYPDYLYQAYLDAREHNESLHILSKQDVILIGYNLY
jgi:hypothetical protein